MKTTLERLAQLGNEDWKTPSHPMNDWVSKETVNRLAEEILAELKGLRATCARAIAGSKPETKERQLAERLLAHIDGIREGIKP
jgi:hypothetical protein